GERLQKQRLAILIHDLVYPIKPYSIRKCAIETF
ncbi:MAG: hypothetical protein ACI9S8_003048, partial [Chlamydiales bacterium]